jgi:hypothetical protein
MIQACLSRTDGTTEALPINTCLWRNGADDKDASYLTIERAPSTPTRPRAELTKLVGARHVALMRKWEGRTERPEFFDSMAHCHLFSGRQLLKFCVSFDHEANVCHYLSLSQRCNIALHPLQAIAGDRSGS